MNDLESLKKWMVAQLGTAEEPKGSNNVLYNTCYYGREVSGPEYPWCVVFLWAGFDACGLSQLFLGGEKTAAVSYVADWAQRHGQWVTGDYRPGDILCYGTEHIGFCLANNGGSSVTAIEGNYGDRVSKVNRQLSCITGAFRPRYDCNTSGMPSFEPDTGTEPEEDWPEENPLPPLPDFEPQPGDIVRIIPGAIYWDGSTVPEWVLDKAWIIRSVYGERAVLNKDVSRFYSIMSPINIRYLTLVKTAAEAAAEAAAVTEYRVQSGDTLWGISQRFLGSGTKYRLIMAENKLKNTNIFPGQTLKIPGKE